MLFTIYKKCIINIKIKIHIKMLMRSKSKDSKNVEYQNLFLYCLYPEKIQKNNYLD